jgi:diguanylate cyclase (GGDEF)-like protein
MDKVKRILIVSTDSKLKDVLSFCFDGWGYEVFLKEPSSKEDIEDIKKIVPDAIIVDIQSAKKEQLDICRALKNNFSTAFIPVLTLINKRQLRTHLLNLKQGVDDYLIKPPDPLDLRIRIEMAIRRAQHSINANSLTGLPGGNILEETLKDKIHKKDSFSFGYIDIDNFKYFNDAYGYQRGDKVILHTAYIIMTILEKLGNPNDFISHIGGDDFAFITSQDKYESICGSLIKNFDNIMIFHYPEIDRKQGYILAKDRTHKIRKISLMSLSIAIVNVDSKALKNIVQVNDKVAEIKRYLKMLPGSKFMADRRDNEESVTIVPQINKKLNNTDNYKPLGQILLEKNLITPEQLEEALNIHWRKGILLGEVLKELNFISEEELKRQLHQQKTNFSYIPR